MGFLRKASKRSISIYVDSTKMAIKIVDRRLSLATKARQVAHLAGGMPHPEEWRLESSALENIRL